VSLTGARHWLEYAVVVAVRAIVQVLPGGAVRGIGATIGLVSYALAPARRRLAIRQLRAAFPTRSEAECRAIARATFAHFGRLIVVLLKFSTLTPEQMRARVEFEGEDRLRAALAAGKGAIVVTGHFSYWEVQGIAQALVLPPMSVLARQLDNPHLQVLLERIRCTTGNHVIYRRGALRRALRALGANETVGILIDQHIQGTDAVLVDFFNRKVATTAAVAALALRTGAPVVPIFSLPLADGRFRLIYEHAVELPAAGSADPVRDLTQRCTDVLERYVRRYPHLWLWMHHRWRDAGEAPARAPGALSASAADEVFQGAVD
jgi:KDO2-lipid IV(A) lauroyltransferase